MEAMAPIQYKDDIFILNQAPVYVLVSIEAWFRQAIGIHNAKLRYSVQDQLD